MKDLEHASQKDSHGVSAMSWMRPCSVYAGRTDPDEKDLVRYNDFVDALVLSAPMPKIPKLSVVVPRVPLPRLARART